MKIYFDMDGVISNFNKGVNDILGIPYELQDQSSEKYHEYLYENMRKYPDFYYMLEPIDDMIDYLKEMYKLYGDKVEILTGIPAPHRGIDNARDNKIAWIKKYINEDIKVNICLSKEKSKYITSKDDILIDDFIKNIKRWENDGGIGILHKNLEETKKKLEIILKYSD